jgi:hypothetical protein
MVVLAASYLLIFTCVDAPPPPFCCFLLALHVVLLKELLMVMQPIGCTMEPHELQLVCARHIS